MKSNFSAVQLLKGPRFIQSSQRRNFSFAYPCPRKLREIVKMSAMERETPETIDHIWTEYH